MPVAPEAHEQPAPRADRTVVHTVSASGGQPVIHGYVYPHTAEDAANAPQPDDEYVPDSALIHRVRIFRWKSRYPYYEEFVRTAEKLLGECGQRCERVPFFSYVPQYSQMNPQQLAWYLYLRECVREGEFPDTDYSYVLLLVYEILNLSDRISPDRGQELLCGIWSGYRERFRQLDNYLPEWICDYSLVHHLSSPACLGGELLAQIMQHCALREFYVSGGAADGYVQVLLAFCCNYDYRKSKFCTPESRELFDRTVAAVLRQATELLSESGRLFSVSGMDDSRLTRDAYSGALCSWRVKRKIEISYCSFSRSHELRFLITDIVKYTENKLRAWLGVRSRLTIYALPVRLRERIDAAVAELLPAKQTANRKQEIPAYERLYDLPETPLSFSNAADIERLSWNTTQKLVEAFAEEGERQAEPSSASQVPPMTGAGTAGAPGREESVPGSASASETVPETAPEAVHGPVSGMVTPSVTGVPDCAVSPEASVRKASTPEASPPQGTQIPPEAGLCDALSPYRAFLEAVLREDSGAQRSEAAKLGRLPDAVADEINELAADRTGDILLEDIGDGYRVLEEYRHLLDGWSPSVP